MVNNFRGVLVMTGMEGEELIQTMDNMHIYGEQYQKGEEDICAFSAGLWLSSGFTGGKGLHPTGASALPIAGSHSAAAWGQSAKFTNMFFHDFQSRETRCGSRQSLVARPRTASDYIPK